MDATWVDGLASAAPDVVAAWRGIEAGAFLSVRREVAGVHDVMHLEQLHGLATAALDADPEAPP